MLALINEKCELVPQNLFAYLTEKKLSRTVFCIIYKLRRLSSRSNVLHLGKFCLTIFAKLNNFNLF